MRKMLFFLLSWYFLLPGTVAAYEVRLATHWLPQAQFAGFYVALEKGFYSKEGIDLKIYHGGPDLVPADRLSSGEVQFATMFLAAAIERKMAGIPLVNIAQLSQHSALMILTKKNANIHTINDLEGKKLAVWANDFQLQPWALLKKHDVHAIYVPFSGSFELFIRGGVPASLAMWYNEYHSVLSYGYYEEELHPLFFKDTEFNFPEDGIYCLQETISLHPEQVDAFVHTTRKGWDYAFQNKQEALTIVEKFMIEAKQPYSKVHQEWMLNTIEKLMKPSHQNLPWQLSKNQFDKVMSTILQTGFSTEQLNYADFVRYKK